LIRFQHSFRGFDTRFLTKERHHETDRIASPSCLSWP
jgi:hypothetical protein